MIAHSNFPFRTLINFPFFLSSIISRYKIIKNNLFSNNKITQIILSKKKKHSLYKTFISLTGKKCKNKIKESGEEERNYRTRPESSSLKVFQELNNEHKEQFKEQEKILLIRIRLMKKNLE